MEMLARTPLRLGACIRERRRQMGMIQEQLAAKVGVRQRTASDIETSASVRLDSARYCPTDTGFTGSGVGDKAENQKFSERH